MPEIAKGKISYITWSCKQGKYQYHHREKDHCIYVYSVIKIHLCPQIAENAEQQFIVSTSPTPWETWDPSLTSAKQQIQRHGTNRLDTYSRPFIFWITEKAQELCCSLLQNSQKLWSCIFSFTLSTGTCLQRDDWYCPHLQLILRSHKKNCKRAKCCYL